ncbi:hypothetical protein TVAG_314700 [Trichomonas vaginalis G3]|uniref:Uncharacterized protein n=1 Tax=Trichomonas vaginalis (strain ATCC PRA-98 / G3) TaxID=412133 RepID=A2ETQ9_TRIV3|nr:armadillo (ARM) repeat-containing protein family [Trichomonas vaginalis G3]EAY03940.1 hypothetical protein TVAG_314700 [Trichomonas vaginalis G3]KAI5541040.1 armadillo (ARM) repeat-containing protein family [Trichomonas vaginalis G3]|eukprot:XP_001316163.1 hypothetical protein [Trichomonas vaginalis G3]
MSTQGKYKGAENAEEIIKSLTEASNSKYFVPQVQRIDVSLLVDEYNKHQNAKILMHLSTLTKAFKELQFYLYTEDDMIQIFSAFVANIHEISDNIIYKSVIAFVKILPHFASTIFTKLSEFGFIKEISTFKEKCNEPFYVASLVLISMFLDNQLGFDEFMENFDLRTLCQIAEIDQNGYEVYSLFKSLTLYIPNSFITATYSQCLNVYYKNQMPSYMLILITDFLKDDEFMSNEIFDILVHYLQNDISQLLTASLQVLFTLVDINIDVFKPLFDLFIYKINDHRISDGNLTLCFQILTKIVDAAGYEIELPKLTQILMIILGRSEQASSILTKSMLFCFNHIAKFAPIAVFEDLLKENNFDSLLGSLESEDPEILLQILEITQVLVRASISSANSKIIELISNE